MVKKIQRLEWFKITLIFLIFYTHAYCLTKENAYFTTSGNNHFYSNGLTSCQYVVYIL